MEQSCSGRGVGVPGVLMSFLGKRWGRAGKGVGNNGARKYGVKLKRVTSASWRKDGISGETR